MSGGVFLKRGDDLVEMVEMPYDRWQIPGVALPESAISKMPSIPFAAFATPGSLARLFEVFEWFLAEATSREPTA